MKTSTKSPRKSHLKGALMIMAILQKIPKYPKKISTPELYEALLADGFECDVRTLQRDLKAICEHFDIECLDDNKPYAYRWLSYASGLSASQLTDQQSVLLQLAQRHLLPLLPIKTKQSLESLFDQAKLELHKSDVKYQKAKAWLGKVGIAPSTQPLIPPKLDDEVMAVVNQALFENHYLQVCYQAPFKAPKSHCVAPLALVQWGVGLYLVVQFEGFNDYRHLALHRISHASIVTRVFERPKDFNLEDYINHGAFEFSTEQMIVLEFSITKKAGYHLTEMRLSHDQQIIEETQAHYRFRATVMDSQMLTWWLARFGEDIWDIQKYVVE